MENPTPLPIGKYRDQVINARRILIGIGIFYTVLAAIMFFKDTTFDLGMDFLLYAIVFFKDTTFDMGINFLFFAIIFFALALFSRTYPQAMFMLGILCFGLILLLGIVQGKFGGLVIFGFLMYHLYLGWQAAKYLAAQTPPAIKDDNILDADMWEENE